MTEPILVTGCARSGTSIVAGILNHCGAFGGNTTGPTPHNKKGQFENTFIRQQIVKPYLRRHGWDPLGQRPLPDIRKLTIDIEWGKKIFQIMEDQGYQDGPWFYKGAKMCLFWPQWHFAFPRAKWIIVRRDDDGIINSCMKTGFMKAYHHPDGWKKWIDAHLARFEEMKEAGLDVVEVWPSKVVEGRYGEMKNAVKHVELDWNRKVIHQFIEPRLWHTKAKKREVA